MLESSVEEKLCVEEALQDNDRVDLNLRGAQWDLIKELCKVLLVLEIATTTVGYSKQVSLSVVLPVVQRLVDHHMKSTGTDYPAVRNFKTTVAKDLRRRFQLSDLPEYFLFSTALDPRHKSLDFLAEEKRAIVWENLIN